jgi:hypothetical protein
MDRKKRHDEDGDDYQQVHGFAAELFDSPGDKGLHLAGSAEWRGGLKHDTEVFAVGVECGDIIGKRFVFASVVTLVEYFRRSRCSCRT